jgi:hypothetical protein
VTPTTFAARLLAALLGMLGHSRHTPCIERHRDAIAERAAAAETAHGVPPAVLLVVGLLESHWGCHPASGGCWGAPVDRRHRLTAGTPDHAARALARSRAVCGSWAGAIARFRSGLCAPWQPAHRAYVATALRLVARAHARAGAPAPPE